MPFVIRPDRVFSIIGMWRRGSRSREVGIQPTTAALNYSNLRRSFPRNRAPATLPTEHTSLAALCGGSALDLEEPRFPLIDFRVVDLTSRTSHRTVAREKSQSAPSSIEKNKVTRKGASARSRATIAIHAGVTQSSEPPQLEIYAALAVSLGILGCIDWQTRELNCAAGSA